jgi:hypothetical protein
MGTSDSYWLGLLSAVASEQQEPIAVTFHFFYGAAWGNVRTLHHEFDSNEIDESDSHLEKHVEPRISTSHGRSIADDRETRRINL